MTPLAEILARRIAQTGPITLADYMAECLLHPAHGYYTRRDPLGAAGDFTTAPEISQMFGELLGLCLAQFWLDMGRPAGVTLAELGPGRGTLMADILRATRGVAGFHAAVSVHLVEASPRLRAEQAARLQACAPVWHDTADSLPDAPLLLVANEFFDALPIRQFRKDRGGWREHVVGLTDGRLAFGLTDAAPRPDLDALYPSEPAGTVVETCPAALAPLAALSGRIGRHGGLALVVDYGGWVSRGDTFQALKAHAFADPFAEPGAADLTAHVDFAALVRATPLAHAYATQGEVLKALGIDARAARLAAGLSGAALESHLAAHRRLTDPAEMGSLFKALALFRADGPRPAGFPADQSQNA
ncbi:MAG: hypothetical protein RIR62_467 [Pseudomonadota bacterium]